MLNYTFLNKIRIHENKKKERREKSEKQKETKIKSNEQKTAMNMVDNSLYQ